MKKIIYEAGTAIIKVVVIYIMLISAIATAAIGVKFPEVGVGALVMSVFFWIISETAKTNGGKDHGSD